MPKVIGGILDWGPLLLLGISPLVFHGSAGEFENVPKMAFLQFWIVIFALIRIWNRQKGQPVIWKITPLDIAVVLFYGFCWLSLLQAINVTQASLHLIHYGASIILFFFLLNTVKDAKNIERYLFMGTLSVMAVSVIGILQYFFDFSRGIEISLLPVRLPLFSRTADFPYYIPFLPKAISQLFQIVSPSSTFSNKNMVAHFISMTVPLSVGAFILSRAIWKKLVSAASIVLTLFYLIFLNRTRSGILAVMVIFIILGLVYIRRLPSFLRIQKNKRIAGICLVLAVTIILALFLSVKIFAPSNEAPFTKLFGTMADSLKGDTAQLRWIWWKNTWEMVKDYPWWGVGLQNFKMVYPLYHRAVAIDWSFTDEHQLTRLHNDHLQMLVELGIFGFCAYLSMFISFFYMFWNIYFRGQNEYLKKRALFICLGVVGFFINATFCFPWERAIPPAYLFTFFALMGVMYLEYSTSNVWTLKIRLQMPVRIFLSLVLITFLCASIHYNSNVLLSDKYFVESLNYDQIGKIDESIEAAKKAKIFSLYNANISAFLGRNYTVKGNYTLALEEYKETFRAHPYNTTALLNTGYCYLQLGNYDEAETYFKKAVELWPDFEQAYNDLGIVYYSKKEYAKAEENYKKAFAINSGYVEPHINLGNLYRARGKVEQAIQEYEITLQIKPDQSETRRWLSGLYTQTGQHEKAQEVLKPLLQGQGTETVENLVLQGNIYQKQGQHEQSLQAYERALRLKPDNPLIYHNIGLAHYYLHNYDQAEAYFRKALALDPNVAESYNLLGQLFLRRQDDKGALELFQKALKVNPKLRDAQFNTGTIYLRLGEYDRSIKAYQDTLAIDPNYTLAHYNLATLYMEKGQKQQALDHFEQSLKDPSPLIDVKAAEGFIATLKKDLDKK